MADFVRWCIIFVGWLVYISPIWFLFKNQTAMVFIKVTLSGVVGGLIGYGLGSSLVDTFIK